MPVATATEWVLNGTKRWITNGSISDIATVWAKDDEGVIRGFLVERGTPGFSASDIKGKFSLRASITSELVLEDVRLPASAILPEAKGLARTVLVSQPGALRDRVGRRRRGAHLLPDGARLRQVAHAVRQAAGRLPARAAEAGAHAERDHQGAAHRVAARAC